jgi:putative transcriptional regulator
VIGSTRGRLLVATPTLLDPNFARTVVFVLEHNEDGALGVVLNRPSQTELGDLLPAWHDHVATPSVVFVGGPVSPDAAIGLAISDANARDGWAPVAHGVGTVDLGRTPDELSFPIERVRVFAGYAGWTESQLDTELAADGWFVVNAEPGDAFAHEPERLWAAVLRRQRSRLSVFANAPRDASDN